MHGRIAQYARQALDGAPAPLSILVVDSDDDARELLAALLSRRGYHVATCADASEALLHLRGERPSIVVIDDVAVRTPLRDTLDRHCIPMVAMTIGDPCECDHIVKPFHLDDLIEVIERALVPR